MYDPKLLPEKLKAGREFRNYSQQGIADALGVHVTSYNKWELGQREPNAIVLAEIAEQERLSIEFYFTDMPAKRADLDHRDDRTEIERLASQVESLRSAVAPRDMDPVLVAIDHSPLLRKFCNRIRVLDETKQQRLIDKLEGYLDGLEELSERDSRAVGSA